MADQSGGGGGGDNIVIHTMKDDLKGREPAKPPAPILPAAAAAKAGPPQPPKLVALPPKPPLPVPITPPPTPKPNLPTLPAPFAPATPTQVPLPPRPAAREGQSAPASVPISIPHHLARRNRKRAVAWAAVIILFLLIVGGGGWAFVTFVSAPPVSQETPAPATAKASEVLPASTGLAVYYHLETPAARGQLLELWQNSPKTLLQGNPKTLLSNPSVAQFMYVGIPGQARPFLVVPKEGMNEQELAQFSSTQVAEYQGWYILHAVNATPFVDALSQGQGIGEQMENNLDENADARPLTIYLSELALNQIRSSLAGSVFTSGSVGKVLLTASATSSGQALTFDGIGEMSALTSALPTPVGGSKVDQSLLGNLPPDATFVRLGGNLSADISAWREVSNVLDKTILEQTNVAALVSQLTGPYAYYHRLGADGAQDLGLAANLPTSVTPPLTLGDAALEQALSALLPLIVPSRPAVNLAFADGVYQETPLRFLNLSGATQALDYTIAKEKLLVASSKEGMFTSLDVHAGRSGALAGSSPWQTLMTQWGAVPVTPQLFLGYLDFVSLVELLPSTETKLPIAATQEIVGSGARVSGVILLSPQSAPTPSATVSPPPAASPTPTPTAPPTPF